MEGSPRPVAARVVRINPSAQAGSRSVLAYLSLADPAGLRQGLFAQGTLAVGRASALAVPLSAVRTDKPFVQVVEDNKVAHKPVQTGAAARRPRTAGWRCRACSRAPRYPRPRGPSARGARR